MKQSKKQSVRLCGMSWGVHVCGKKKGHKGKHECRSKTWKGNGICHHQWSYK